MSVFAPGTAQKEGLHYLENLSDVRNVIVRDLGDVQEARNAADVDEGAVGLDAAHLANNNLHIQRREHSIQEREHETSRR
jgi:hypothetical protein